MRRLLLILAAAEAADVASTWYVLATGRTEGNPAVAAVLAVGGIAAFVALKCFVWALVCWLAMTWPSRAVAAAVTLGIAGTVFFSVLNVTGGS